MVTTKREFEQKCGPYGGHKLQRFRMDATVGLHEAKTGSKLAEQTFKGATPSCPRSTSVFTLDGNSGASEQVIGLPDAKAIRKWVQAKSK